MNLDFYRTINGRYTRFETGGQILYLLNEITCISNTPCEWGDTRRLSLPTWGIPMTQVRGFWGWSTKEPTSMWPSWNCRYHNFSSRQCWAGCFATKTQARDGWYVMLEPQLKLEVFVRGLGTFWTRVQQLKARAANGWSYNGVLPRLCSVCGLNHHIRTHKDQVGIPCAQVKLPGKSWPVPHLSLTPAHPKCTTGSLTHRLSVWS